MEQHVMTGFLAREKVMHGIIETRKKLETGEISLQIHAAAAPTNPTHSRCLVLFASGLVGAQTGGSPSTPSCCSFPPGSEVTLAGQRHRTQCWPGWPQRQQRSSLWSVRPSREMGLVFVSD
ncbi:hypothetical protein AOXY_G1209 [Acipenser oxyrinchus oxyrinchus]|uniref:Uncharacterized protein n=1 Tax=Acipenser oxyrinchus oxyrinchus TaxID=40147 RepID=A0AAD8GKM2_ACIOX|nr:hypothetical protein AOXY_G1209 [Acipenser oxyrinchus oxyrinchus]